MRLTIKEQEVIKQAFFQHFMPNDKLWLFGSRADTTRLGGDIDLYIETNFPNGEKALAAKMAFVSTLWAKLGEQKIDVVLNLLKKPYDLPIYKVAKKEGVRIV